MGNHQTRMLNYSTFEDWVKDGLVEAVNEGVDETIAALEHMAILFQAENPGEIFNPDSALQQIGITPAFHARIKKARDARKEKEK